MRHIAVVGAGIAGVTTAYALSQRGLNVTVFDRNRYAAMETSFANGGQLSASNAEVWTKWATIFKGLKWMFQPGAPLLVNPTPTWHKLTWLAEFIASIPNYEANTKETVRLAIQARSILKGYAQTEGFAFDCEDRGILHIYANTQELRHARNVNRLLTEAGLERHEVSADEARVLEPTLTGSDLVGAFYTPSDFTGDIHRYSANLAKACVKHGVVFQYATDVLAAKHTGDGIVLTYRSRHGDDRKDADQMFDGVVICAGVRSRELASQLGDRVNVYPVKGYSLTVNLDDADSRAAAPWVSLLDDESKIVSSRLGEHRLRIAGTAEIGSYNLDIRDSRIKPLTQWCERWFPGVSTENCVPWAGLRPMMPSMLPRVGAGARPGVFYNTGHGHLGWTLSAATAEITAETVAAAMLRNDRTPAAA